MATTLAPSWIRQTLLTLPEAARLLPPYRHGRPVSVSCVSRWIRHGLRTPHGQVRLEAFRLGRRWLTSIEALERFAAAQTPELPTN